MSRQILLIWYQCIFDGLAHGIRNFTFYIVRCCEELYANILKSFFLNGINTGIYDFVKKRNVFLRCLYVHTLQHLSIILILWQNDGWILRKEFSFVWKCFKIAERMCSLNKRMNNFIHSVAEYMMFWMQCFSHLVYFALAVINFSC